MAPATPQPRSTRHAAPFLEGALAFGALAHLTMTWWPGAAAGVLVCAALLRTPWVPRRPAWVALGVTCASIVAGRFGGTAVTSAGHLLAGLAWTWCFIAAGIWSKRLAWTSAATWGSFAVAATAGALPSLRASAWMTLANAAASVLLVAWWIVVTEKVAARCRPVEADGRYAPWRHPAAGLLGRAFSAVANSHFVRCVFEWIPLPALVSDVKDAVYVNYLVDADALEGLVPEGMALQRIGPDEQYALFTFVTFRHGHLGPAIFGPLRQHLPSPIQSNWRIYVVDRNTSKRGVFHLTTATNSTLHALAGRILGEGSPMHVPRRADLLCDASGTVHLAIDPGTGTAPDARATLRPSLERTIPPGWVACFGDWDRFLLYCLAQERSLGFQPWYERVSRREVELTASPKDCRRIDGAVESGAASQIVGNANALCFHVRQAKARFERVAYDRRVTPAPAKVPAPPPVPSAMAA